jgi:TetR/AcrR family transcriptional regulator, ethionamide resistance regulator
MAVASQRSRDDRRDEIRRRLLVAVEGLIAEGASYANVSVERLAGAARISRATFYIYFDGKGDLLQAWLRETLDELRAGAQPLLAVRTEGEVASTLHTLLLGYRRRATVMAAILDEATRDGALRADLDAAIGGAISALSDAIERGQRDRWIDPELLAQETAAWLVWLLERGLTQVIPTAGDERIDALASTLAQMLWRTLRVD